MSPAIRIYAAFHQVYLFDELACPPYPEDITDADLERRVKAAPNILAIYASDEREVELQIEVAVSRVKLNAAQWLHIVEAPLAVPSGNIVVASPETYLPDAWRVPGPAGSYQVCVAGRGFTDSEREEYLLTMWPAKTAQVSVTKSGGPYAA